jgi:hypothetical protein
MMMLLLLLMMMIPFGQLERWASSGVQDVFTSTAYVFRHTPLKGN